MLDEGCWMINTLPVYRVFEIDSEEISSGGHDKIWRVWLEESYDDGRTWRRYQDLARNSNSFSPRATTVFIFAHATPLFPFSIALDRYGPVEFENRIIQPAIWVDQAGMTHMVARSLRKYMVATHSKDNGHSWMPPILTGVPCPNSGLDVVGGDQRLKHF